MKTSQVASIIIILSAADVKVCDCDLAGWRDRVHAPDKGDSPLEKAKGIVDRYVGAWVHFSKACCTRVSF